MNPNVIPHNSARRASPMRPGPRAGLFSLFIVGLHTPGSVQSGIITTCAGPHMPVTGGPATSALLACPESVAVDAAGNLFIGDSLNNRILKVTPDGVITTVTGKEISGLSGDGGPVTSAQLSAPASVAVDAAGNLFVADTENNRIRKITPDGATSIVAGNGNRGFSGDGGSATSAQLYRPGAIAVDSAGNLFIADGWNYRIRKVTPDGAISTVAGNGRPGFSDDGGPATSAQLGRPNGVAVDAAGNLFISASSSTGERFSWFGDRIRKVTTGGAISTVAGNGHPGFSGDSGPATSARFFIPEGMALDAAGNLFIADTGNHRVRKVTSDGVISTVAGNGHPGFSGDGRPATLARLAGPSGVAVDAAGSLFIADAGNCRIRQVTRDGVISTVAGDGRWGFGGDGGPATSAQLDDIHGIAVDTAGNLFITDGDIIRRIAGGPGVSMDLTLIPGCAASSITVGEGEADQAGCTAPTVNPGKAPHGTAVFSFRQHAATVGEAAVPASPPGTLARIIIDCRSGVPVHKDPAVNFARYIDQLKEIASGFDLPLDDSTSAGFGSLEILSDQPILVVALRETINGERRSLRPDDAGCRPRASSCD